MKIRAILLGLLAFIIIGSALANKNEESVEKKKIIFLTGDDLTHGSGTHEFYAGALLLQNAFNQGVFKDQLDITIVNNWPEDTSVFEGADVIVHYYKGNKSHPMNKNHAFINTLAQKGVSQMFMHYAVDPNGEAEPSLTDWTGAVYKDGFSTNPHWLMKSQLQNHPINNGVATYESYDEWYTCMQFEKEPGIKYEKADTVDQVYSVMFGTNEEFIKGRGVRGKFKRELSDAELTVLWAKQRKDGGRGVGLTGGHYHKNWANNAFRKQVLNAIIWCAKITVPEIGVGSPAVSEEEINKNLDDRKRGGIKKITLK